MGPSEGKLIEQMIRDNVELPDHIKNAPELLHGLELFYNGFQDLSSCRSVGFSIGPIPWTATDQYCTRFKIRGDQRDDFFYYVELMDEAYRAYVDKKSKPSK